MLHACRRMYTILLPNIIFCLIPLSRIWIHPCTGTYLAHVFIDPYKLAWGNLCLLDGWEPANQGQDGSGYIGHVGLQWQVPKSSISLREKIPTNNSLKRNLAPYFLTIPNNCWMYWKLPMRARMVWGISDIWVCDGKFPSL